VKNALLTKIFKKDFLKIRQIIAKSIEIIDDLHSNLIMLLKF